MKRIRDLTSNTASWVTGQRTVADGIFDFDLPIALHGVGTGLGTKFETSRCSTVGEIDRMMPADIINFICSTRGVTRLRINRLVVCAQLEKPGRWDGELIDHQKAANPYESRYGN